ncbi:large ribosomal subunit protein mL40 [Tribolium castaneum]|uniref:Large ribosomal subunit protein mL40 n=1 Tax=Tribolium castaneum TaxID=7070 RepID=D6WU16_TRICA|nr:PREDICTED: 39S ribosomal protein L40, mitochondrial [Tribolium castaneum]EFA07359.2 39S ribosomal protein L40, mitochondrial-like Protein [Tribolium castaneum]|eukprot:XP_971553.2 PREDICTED: 39S ribosomal protein L40, mitochondrial [Tribolium castaneum]
MSAWSLINTFNRLALQSCPRRGIATSVFLNFRATPCLMAEPLKKKKKLDPAVIKAREDRKKKKIEKQIRRLEKHARQFKPIEECEVPLTLLDEKKSRMRSLPALSDSELEQRALLDKQWATYRKNEHLTDVQMLDRIFFAQQKALDELRKESEELYQEAMQIDFRLLPFKSEGPLETPAIDNYESPDGDYADVSKKWE